MGWYDRAIFAWFVKRGVIWGSFGFYRHKTGENEEVAREHCLIKSGARTHAYELACVNLVDVTLFLGSLYCNRTIFLI